MSVGRVLQVQQLTSLRLFPLLRDSQAPQCVSNAVCRARWDRTMATGEPLRLLELCKCCSSPVTEMTVRLYDLAAQVLQNLMRQKALAGCLAGCGLSCQVCQHATFGCSDYSSCRAGHNVTALQKALEEQRVSQRMTNSALRVSKTKDMQQSTCMPTQSWLLCCRIRKHSQASKKDGVSGKHDSWHGQRFCWKPNTELSAL